MTLYPAVHMVMPGKEGYSDQNNFPVRFKIETSDDPQFKTAALITDQTGADFPDPHIDISHFPATAQGRYVRLTVTKWSASSPWVVLPTPAGYLFALAKMDVLAGGKDVAELCPVQTDPVYGNGAASQITRPPRPMGESIRHDEPHNVLPADREDAPESNSRHHPFSSGNQNHSRNRAQGTEKGRSEVEAGDQQPAEDNPQPDQEEPLAPISAEERVLQYDAN